VIVLPDGRKLVTLKDAACVRKMLEELSRISMSKTK
jgi:hypothetical protein